MTLKATTEYEFDLRTVRLERNASKHLWLYTDSGFISGDDASWRELLLQLQDMLGDAPKEEKPDPRGYVFIDDEGDAWGWRSSSPYRAPKSMAARPFRSHDAAKIAGDNSPVGWSSVEIWTPECGVPPMPEDAP